MGSPWSGRRDIDALVENVEKLTGRRGNGLHRAVTLEELARLNIVAIRRSSSGTKVLPAPPPSPPGLGPVERPTLPEGVQGFGGFGSILLRWNVPSYVGHAHTEIWKASPDNEGKAPVLTEAVIIGTSKATLFTDVVSLGTTFYYWVRHVNTNDVAGPYSDEAGIRVQTSADIGDVINEIGEQLAQSELIAFLQQDIADTQADFENLWAVKEQAGDITAGIGLLAKEDGTSQVAIAASSFVVFDPNEEIVDGEEATLSPLFAIDNGAVYIPSALIRKATIQILEAEQITADHVVAGISIDSPQITAATLVGGDAFFGVGGPYSGYHTHITNDGRIYTDDLYASGYIFGAQIYSTSLYSSEIHGTNITGGSIYGARITTVQNYYACLGDNRSTRFYPWNSGLSVACLPRFSGRHTVSAGRYDSGWKLLSTHLWGAGDLTTSRNLDETRRFRFRTIPRGAIRITMNAPRAGSSRFGGFRLAIVNHHGGVLATSDAFVSALAHSRVLYPGATFTCGQMTFVVDSVVYNGNNKGGMFCRFSNAVTLFGPGWTTNPATAHRIAIRQESAHDDGGFSASMEWDVNNAIDPR